MSISRSKIGNMAIKIDLEKAYDRLEWSFIRLTLQYFNLPQCWIDLIMSCISSSYLSILVNGEKTDSFAPSLGIHQGDPLSPYIFILCMEYLAWLIEVEVTNGSWKGIKVSRELTKRSLLTPFVKLLVKRSTTANLVFTCLPQLEYSYGEKRIGHKGFQQLWKILRGAYHYRC